ncbi:MAG: HAD-IB family hydrolase [Coriobacteriaceae bacterium]|jgi:HAD superfamily hydrolase (TIGR01490 family)|nr:HAD-IB family hydrolase [Coriobacteriaceae bacterium]
MDVRAPVQLAVFDFDGTSITGNSPVLLVRYLQKHRMLKVAVVAKIAVWAFAYKFRLPQKEAWVRSLVFTAFEGKPQGECDQFLRDFYDAAIEKRFRVDADAAMRDHAQAGRTVVVISATFEPIVARAMDLHPFDHQISTRMRVDGAGRYTREVEGKPIQGEEKVEAIRRFADAEYGQGAWELAYAYGDHHSDRPLLAAARHAFAVTPDCPLAWTARRQGWKTLTWT